MPAFLKALPVKPTEFHDDVDQLLRLARQREEFEHLCAKLRPADGPGSYGDLLARIGTALEVRFWEHAEAIGARLGWPPAREHG